MLNFVLAASMADGTQRVVHVRSRSILSSICNKQDATRSLQQVEYYRHLIHAIRFIIMIFGKALVKLVVSPASGRQGVRQ